ncbi:ComEC/Rec2 family competence protein [Bosea sp. AAP35]|uniref:ComEC/Rec2 family competence protein n=1 Tax=Bosea sp. AAP35 TaxID=1523417 RepID=UPI0018D13157|nr:ComEC/Rec2 family competence protein [Bosea sp. AAP35]
MAWRARLFGALSREAERRRLFLWLPVLMGAGILLYFAADSEPALAAPLSGLALAAGAAFALRRRRIALMVCLGLCAAFVGFAAATWRTATVASPMLDRPRIGLLTGFVEAVEARDAGARLVILVTGIAGLEPAAWPRRVRVNVRSGTVSPGDHIAAVARLLPPPGPARPGGYDFGRDAFFRGLGAVGSIPGKIALTPPPHPPPPQLSLAATVDRARNALTRRIAEIGGGQAGAMAAALVTGKRGLITETTNADLRAAGIYHIVSISGLHMVLAAGTIFWLVRAVLALSRTLALGFPIKKIAALAAMAGATAYCVFSGAEVATVRSLIMTLVMLGAILVDRPALSMRNLALAAIIVLLREPEALLGPSFQMSFGAVAALIAFAERWEERSRAQPPSALPWPLRPLWIAVTGIIVTTLLATAATAPFGAYHFQTFNPFGLLGNALALPFVSLFVMPAAVFGVLAYPFGLDAPAWWLMGLASHVVLQLAHWVAGIDHSTVVIAAFGPAALSCFAASLLWATLWTTKLRLLAILPLIGGVMIAAKPERPEIQIERDGSGIAVRGRDGLLVVAGKPSRFVLQQWLTADGDSRNPDDASLRQGAACDAQGCVIRTKDGRNVAYARERLAIIEDCRRADLVVTPIPWTAPCKAPLIDRTALGRDGATALVARAEGWRSHAAEQAGGNRPWTRQSAPPLSPSSRPAAAVTSPSDDGPGPEPLQ